MTRDEQILDYNYSDFDENALAHIMEWVNNQPPLGKKAPDFPLWQLKDGSGNPDMDNPLEETTLMTAIRQHKLTIVVTIQSKCKARKNVPCTEHIDALHFLKCVASALEPGFNSKQLPIVEFGSFT